MTRWTRRWRCSVGSAVESFGETGPLRVRMGVHTCEAEYRDGDYFGSEVNRAARLMSVAHGGQIVVSLVTSGLVRGGQVELVDLGEHRLRDLASAERVFQVLAPGLEQGVPAVAVGGRVPGELAGAGDVRSSVARSSWGASRMRWPSRRW